MISESVAVLGYGVFNPVANNTNEFKEALFEGRQHLTPLQDVPIPRNKNLVGLVNKSIFETSEYCFEMSKKVINEAIAEIQLNLSEQTVGLFLGTMSGDSKIVEDHYDKILSNQLTQKELFNDTKVFPTGSLLNRLAYYYRCLGPRLVVSNACASGNIACGLAFDAIRRGECNVAIVVGAEVFKLSALWGAERAGFVGTHCAPFSEDRDGAILGEGASAIILAKPTIVKEKAKAWISGFGCVCDKDAAAITLAEDGSGLIASMQLAVNDSAQPLTCVDYINAHAPGTRMIDYIECSAVNTLFQEHSKMIDVNSTKSITTHLAGASAITEIVATAIQMEESFVHPNMCMDRQDPSLKANIVGSKSYKKKITFGLSNACGGGGLNATIAVSKKQMTAKLANKKENTFVITGLGVVRDHLLSLQHKGQESNIFYEEQLPLLQYYPESEHYHYCNEAAQLAAISGKLALTDAGFTPENLYYENDRFGVFAGTALGGSVEAMHKMCEKLIKNPKTLKPSDSLDHGIHLGASLVCRHYNLIGTTNTLTGTRNASLQALWAGLLSLKSNRLDGLLVLGYDSASPLQEMAYQKIHKNNYKRNFCNVGAGLVIENTESAISRGATMLAEVIRCCNIGIPIHSIIESKKQLKNILTPSIEKVERIYFACDPKKPLKQLRRYIQKLTGISSHQMVHLSNESPDPLAGYPMLCLTQATMEKGHSLIIGLDQGGSLSLVEISSLSS